MEPQFGVSFGLPYPSGAYPLNQFNGGSPAQNPYFGSISPNGLNLGLVNVNPLVSLQFAKNEFGEKTFKPLVNFHVTPNEHLISKVGNLFKAKKYGVGGSIYGGQSSYNQHYHTHTHYPTPTSIYRPQNYYDNAHHYHGQPEIYPAYGGSEYGFTGPGNIYRDTFSPYDSHGASNYHENGYPSEISDFDTNVYSRSFNSSGANHNQSQLLGHSHNYQNVHPQNNRENSMQAANEYASEYQDYMQKQLQGAMQTMKTISFPTNRRRKRNVQTEDIDGESNAPKSKTIEKVRLYTPQLL